MQFTVEGEEAVGVEGGGLVQLGGKHQGKQQRRYATVHREVAGQQPPAVQTDVSSKATKPGCSSVTRFSVQKVGGRHVPQAVIGFCDTYVKTPGPAQ